VLGHLGFFWLPFLGVIMSIAIWTMQAVYSSPLAVVSVSIVVASNLIIAGSLYGSMNQKLKNLSENMATKKDLVETENRIIKMLDEKYVNKSFCNYIQGRKDNHE